MIKATLNWYGAQVLESVLAKSFEGLARAVTYFHTAVAQRLNVSAGPMRVKRKRNTAAGKKGTSYTTYNNPSKPGEPPHKRTGWLQRNTIMSLDKRRGTGLVGTLVNAKYGAILELKRDRSYLLSTLRLVMPRLRILAGGG